jgi:hypothetical protein
MAGGYWTGKAGNGTLGIRVQGQLELPGPGTTGVMAFGIGKE